MRLDDPFPIEVFARQTRATIRAEFGGRCPSVGEVMGLPDDYWLKLPGFGPARVRKLRSVIDDLVRERDEPIRLPDGELLAEHRQIVEELSHLGSLLGNLQIKLRVIEAELRMRRLLPGWVVLGLIC